jgi:hypothetical protein
MNARIPTTFRVPCPHPGCGAQVGQACRTAGSDRRLMKVPHMARVRAARPVQESEITR